VSAADVAGVRVLVTGGTSGLGRAMAAALIDGGARVALTGRDADRASAVARELPGDAVGIGMDVRDMRSVDAGVAAATETLGGIDVLVNNAGIGMRTVNPDFLTRPQPFYDVDLDGFDDLFATNVRGYFLVARAVVPAMLRAGHGKVVNISINPQTMTRRGFAPYGPSRAATDALSAVMAADLEGTGVDVFLLLPGGATASGMIPEHTPPEVRAGLLDPSVMGPAIRWLCSPASDGRSGLRVIAKDFAAPDRPACVHTSAADLGTARAD
jgi:gluconate 5-dehydrogenase